MGEQIQHGLDLGKITCVRFGEPSFVQSCALW